MVVRKILKRDLHAQNLVITDPKLSKQLVVPLQRHLIEQERDHEALDHLFPNDAR